MWQLHGLSCCSYLNTYPLLFWGHINYSLYDFRPKTFANRLSRDVVYVLIGATWMESNTDWKCCPQKHNIENVTTSRPIRIQHFRLRCEIRLISDIVLIFPLVWNPTNNLRGIIAMVFFHFWLCLIAWAKFTVVVYKELLEILIGSFSNLHIYYTAECNRPTYTHCGPTWSISLEWE